MVSEADLKFEEMRQKRELDLAELVRDMYKAKNEKEKKDNPDFVGYLLAGGVGLTAAAGLILTFIPEARQGLARMLGFAPQKQETVMAPNPQPIPQHRQEPEGEPITPHYTKGGNLPPSRLTYKMAHSSTSYDAQSIAQRARTQEVIRRADLARAQALDRYQKKTVSFAVPQDRRLTYGSGGSGGTVKLNKPRSQRRKWIVVKAK